MKVSERRLKTFWPNLRRSLWLLPLLCKVEKLEANEHTTLFKSIAEVLGCVCTREAENLCTSK
jgi:hypothetical protein